MGYESTVQITREEAVSKLTAILATKIATLSTMSNEELENLLYANTRDTNYFDNFSVR
jgi:hypothetical protein